MSFSYWYVVDKNNHVEVESIKQPYDIGVILGAAVWSNNEPSTLFKKRIDKGLELLNHQKVKYLQLTGGNAPGEFSEARAAQYYLHNKGVSNDFIRIEEKTSTTSQQVQFIKEKLIPEEDFNRIAVISDQFHMARVLEMSKFYNMKIDGVASDYNLSTEKILYYNIRESVALLLFWLFGI